MYLEQPFSYSASRVEDLVRLSQQLDIAPGPGGSRFSPWAPTRKLYQDELAGFFKNIVQVAVVSLQPSSQIVAHKDEPITGTRYHIPIQLNDRCWVYHAGLWQQLRLGRVYQMDPTEVHGAVNWGETVRLHLLVDVS